MHLLIRHFVSDPAKWDRAHKNILSMVEQRRLPTALKPLQYLPSFDGRNVDSVWEAESLGALQRFIDRETAGAARNEYFEVKDEAALGLPRGELLARAA